MDIGDEILIRAKVVDFDSNPHGPSIKVQVCSFDPVLIDKGWDGGIHQTFVNMWIHRIDKQRVIVNKPGGG